VVVDCSSPSLVPHPDPVVALVYGARAGDVETVVCDGEVVCDGDGSRVRERYPDLVARARAAARQTARRAGLTP
jgi:cytosine/adenosine deaminase-related metal-dependent hydrolase